MGRSSLLAWKLQGLAGLREDRMKAVVIHATGGPEQLVVADLPDPAPVRARW
jgi:hypothetical protein